MLEETAPEGLSSAVLCQSSILDHGLGSQTGRDPEFLDSQDRESQSDAGQTSGFGDLLAQQVDPSTRDHALHIQPHPPYRAHETALPVQLINPSLPESQVGR